MYLWLFAVGVIHTPLYSKSLPSLALLALGCVLGFIGGVSPSAYRKLIFSPMFFVFGTTLGSFQINRLCEAQLDPRFEGQVYGAVLQVVSIPDVNSQSLSFMATVRSLDCLADDSSKPNLNDCPDITAKTIRVSWYHPKQKVTAGQLWHLSVKLKRPRGFVNPQGFDYQAWLLSQGVIATGSVRQNKKERPVLVSYEPVWASVRQKTKERLLGDEELKFRRFWSALLVGDKSDISKQDWSILQKTGTVHLMAISGLHIGLVALGCFLFGSVVARCSTFLLRGAGVLPQQFIPPLLSIAGALYYSALAGFSIPTVRALTACIIVNLCRITHVKMSSTGVLGCCVLVVSLLEPLAWVNSGFWLSFVAVALLMYCFGSRTGGDVRGAWLKVQLALTVGMLMPLVFIGQGFSLISPIANIIAVPVVSLLMVPVLLGASLLQTVSDKAAHWLIHSVDFLFGWLWSFLTWLQDFSFARWWPSQELNISVLLVGFVGCLMLLAPLGLRVRTLGIAWLLCAGLGVFSAHDDFKMTIFDVGQGLAVHIKSSENNWIYDTGPRFSESFDSGSGIIAPHLRKVGVGTASVIVSHADSDHSGGLQGLMDSINVEELIYGESISGVNREGQPCKRGQSWQSGQLNFSVLWPPREAEYHRNRASCVILMRYQNRSAHISVLFTGDIDRSVEKQILSDLPFSVDILIAPHHGSRSSSSQAFIKRVNPSHVVFSSGFGNRYHHPSGKVVMQYGIAGATTYNTATDGAVEFVWSDVDGLHANRLRKKAVKPWYLAPDP